MEKDAIINLLMITLEAVASTMSSENEAKINNILELSRKALDAKVQNS